MTSMKRALVWGGRAALGIGAIIGGFAAYVQWDGIPRFAPPPKDERAAVVTPETVAQGQKLATLLCVGCHADPDTHRLTGKAMSDLPSEFGAIYSKNITQHPTQGIGGWTDGELRTSSGRGSFRADSTCRRTCRSSRIPPTQRSTRSSRSCDRTIHASRLRMSLRRACRSRAFSSKRSRIRCSVRFLPRQSRSSPRRGRTAPRTGDISLRRSIATRATRRTSRR